MNTALFVGVDGGGSKTSAWLADKTGEVVGKGLAGSSNLNTVGFESACLALQQAIEQALAQSKETNPGHIVSLALALAGVGSPVEQARFQTWAQVHFPQARLQILNDAELLLSVYPHQPCLALIAGTGSIAYARTKDGIFLRAGGWGHLFGDEGSAFAIGAAALHWITQAHDGLASPTALTELILAARHLQTPPELIANLYGAENPRAEIASLARQVEQAAARGDPAARRILRQAARQLAELCLALARRAAFSQPVPLVFSGGALLHGKFLQSAFRAACRAKKLSISTFSPFAEPVQAALNLAILPPSNS